MKKNRNTAVAAKNQPHKNHKRRKPKKIWAFRMADGIKPRPGAKFLS